MNDRLLLETLIESQPGVQDFSLERDFRGAVLQVRATVTDEQSRARLTEMVARTIGRHFAEERLIITTLEKNGQDLGRVRLAEVSTTVRGGRIRADVSLTLDGHVAGRGREGTNQPGASMRLSAGAAVDALTELLGWDASVAIEHVALNRLDDETIVVVGVVLQTSRILTRLYGVSRVGSAAAEAAAARAVLAALNRSIT